LRYSAPISSRPIIATNAKCKLRCSATRKAISALSQLFLNLAIGNRPPLGQLKALPKDGKPISLWTNENVAYLDIVTELRRLLKDTQTIESGADTEAADGSGSPSKRYRIRKEFDSIDRDDFRQKSFAAIEAFFRHSIDELNDIGDPIRARFEKAARGEFSCTVLNKAARSKEAYITVRSGGEGPFASSVTYSYSRHSSSINGFITVEANEYELYLKSDGFGIHRMGNSERMSAEEAADGLWREFISRLEWIMSRRVHFHCHSCGENFYADVLDDDEKLEHIRARKPHGPVRCPQCGSTNLLRG
jgi:hypothetical protein